MWRGIVEEYRAYLPVGAQTPVVTLNEGNTPLIHASWLSQKIGARVYLKYEGLNPTGSFKDRGMTLALSKAKESGADLVVCASTGNTSASAAAYAAKAGIRCVVLIPSGQIALGKLSQALIHQAQVIAIKGNFDTALRMVQEISKNKSVTLVNSLNPHRLQGQKTAASEICDQLGGSSPDIHAMPVGNAGNISAYWMGYKEYREKGQVGNLPVMLGFQAQGAAPIVQNKIVKNPRTIATAIRIGNPASWKMAVAAREESQGRIEAVSDKEILEAYGLLASHEGIFAEPASASCIAGILKLARRNYFGDGTKKIKRELIVVCVLTGHGLKDPERAMASVKRFKTVPARLDAVMKAIET